MAIVTTDDRHYTDIAEMIRNQGDFQAQYRPEQLAEGIRAACEKRFTEGKAAGHIVRTGTFTPETDTNALYLQIPANAKMIDIVPENTPSEAVSASRMPVHYLLALEQFRENNLGYKDLGAMVQYCYNARYYNSFYAYDVSDGFAVELASSLVFEANMTYRWTAHYW